MTALCSSRHLRNPKGILIGAAVVVLVLMSPACGRTQDPPPAEDPGLSHVHGLGVNPDDGVLYAATHHGLFQVPENGEPVRVANRFQDTMGFVVIGPDRFLGSGHPDLQDKALRRDGQPPLLGLIESRDAGESWRPLSLLGEADLHAIAVAGDRIAAYDATQDRLLVSDDGRRWETRVSGIGMSGVVLHPGDPSRIVAVTPSGLELSADEGATFAPLADAPRAVLAAWGDGVLWAVDADGTVWTAPADTLSALESASWAAAGRLPGSPQAFAATGSTVFAAVDVDGRSEIHRSDDAGRTWKSLYRDEPRGS